MVAEVVEVVMGSPSVGTGENQLAKMRLLDIKWVVKRMKRDRVKAREGEVKHGMNNVKMKAKRDKGEINLNG